VTIEGIRNFPLPMFNIELSSKSPLQKIKDMLVRLERFCMGKFQTQKLIRPIVRKDVYTY
jgi:hypothetical protein